MRRTAQIVFQNPDSSLNPRKTIRELLGRPIARFGLAPAGEIPRRVDELLDLVRLPVHYADRYPHQMSGGEKQRVGIARALATQPRFIVCDEPVSALDVSVQAAIVNLLADLKDRLGVAYLFISHDISVVAHLADRVAVMHHGKIVEAGQAGAISERAEPPLHDQAALGRAARRRTTACAAQGRPRGCDAGLSRQAPVLGAGWPPGPMSGAYLPQRRASGSSSRASSISPSRVLGCSDVSGWRTASDLITPPSFITALAERRPHWRFS